MASFLKDFLKDEAKKLDPASSRPLFLAMFGKQPAWQDHFDPIGLGSASLVMASKYLYDGGIGKLIVSGAWNALAPEEQLSRFGHLLVWSRGNQLILGRIWASSDSSEHARKSYPLIVCLHVGGVSVAWAIRNLLPPLEEVAAFSGIESEEELEKTLKRIKADPDSRGALRQQVVEGLGNLEQRLRQRIAGAPGVSAEPMLEEVQRREFIAREELGPDQEGLLRILHQVMSRFSGYLGAKRLTRRDAGLPPAAQLRIPVAAKSALEGIICWIAFFRRILASDTPMLFTAPLDGDWIDLTVGEPSGDQLFCLRATPKAVPLVNTIPYTLDQALKEKGSQIVADFLADSALAAQEPPTELHEQKGRPFAQVSTGTSPPRKSRKTVLWLAAVGLVGVVVLVVFFLLPNSPLSRFLGRSDQASPSPVRPTNSSSPNPGSIVMPSEFSNALVRARAAEATGNLSNALNWYLRAQSGNSNDSQVMAKITELREILEELDRLRVTEQVQKMLASAQAAEGRGNLTEALNLYSQAQRLDPSDDQLAAKMQELERKAEALRQQGLQRTRQIENLLDSARSAEQEGSFTNALELYQQVLAKTNDTAVAGKIRALTPKAEEQLRLAEEARRKQEAALAAEERFTEALEAARAAEKANDLALALDRYEAAQDLKPGEPECVAKIQFLRQAISEAKALDSAVESAQEQEAAGDLAAALVAWRKVLARDPDHREATNAVARLELALATPEPVDLPASGANKAQPPESASPTEMTSSIGMKLVWVPNLPETDEGGYVGQYEVTQEEYMEVMGKNPSKFDPRTQREMRMPGSLQLPVEGIAYRDAARFCSRLTTRDHEQGALPDGWVYLLPSTRQWEFFRADATFRDSVTSCNQPIPRKSPMEVGQLGENNLGLYDVLGNVWEWCRESEGRNQVVKGGDFRVTCDANGNPLPSPPGPLIGFRCIAVPKK